MGTKTKTLLTRALALPDDERAELLEKLAESFPPGFFAGSEEEFRAELNRRSNEAMRDPSVLIPEEEVHRQALREIRKIQRQRRNGKR